MTVVVLDHPRHHRALRYRDGGEHSVLQRDEARAGVNPQRPVSGADQRADVPELPHSRAGRRLPGNGLHAVEPIHTLARAKPQ